MQPQSVIRVGNQSHLCSNYISICLHYAPAEAAAALQTAVIKLSLLRLLANN